MERGPKIIMSAPSFLASVALSVLLIGVAILHPRLCKTAAWSAVFQTLWSGWAV